MSFVKFLRSKASDIPATIRDGFIYIVRANRSLFVDYDGQRTRLNPPADWNQSNTDDPAYIANKPTTISGYGITNAYTKSEVDNLVENVENTTYTLSQDAEDGHKITLTPSSGSPTTITIPDDNTTYSEATTSLAGLMSSSDKTKLNSINQGAEVNQNAFSNIKVGSTTIAADGKTDTLEFAGSNVTITPDATNDKVTIGLTKSNVTSALGYTPPTENTVYDDTSLKNRVTATESAITTLNGDASTTGSVRKITADAVASIVASAPSDYDTLKEISDWISGHASDASAMNTSIVSLSTRMGSAETKLSGIASGAEVNQNAFSVVKIGTTNVAADSKTDTLEFAGSNVTLTPDATNDKITIGITKQNVTNALGYTPPTSNTTYVVATSTASGLMTSTHYNKLEGIAEGAEVNQNAFSVIKIGSTNVQADTKTDTLELAGSNVTITPDATNDKVTIGITKANVTSALGYTPPTSNTNTTYILTQDSTDGHKITFTPSSGTATTITIPDNNTEYEEATTSAAGLMSASDKTKLDGIATGAEVNQNAFSNVKIGSTTVAADTNTDTLELVGSNVTLTPDATNDKVTIGITKANVTSALGYTPPTTNTTYEGMTEAIAKAGAETTNKLISASVLDAAITNKGYTTNTGTVTSVSGSVGLTGSVTTSGSIKANLASETALTNAALTGDTTTTKVYPVVIDKNSKLAVAVPWVDTNTTYTANTISIGSASAGTAIAADDITGWTTNTPTEVTAKTVVTGGTKTSIPNITKKTVVTGVTKKTVVTGGSTTDVPNISKKTVVTSASGATATYSDGVLTFTNGSFSTGDSVTVGTAIKAYTSLSTGDSVTVTTGDSVTVGTAIEAYTSLSTGDSVEVTPGTAASLSYTARSIPNISVTSKTVATGITAS